jgi:hypothetical protein
MAWYRTGTITVTNGSTTVTGSGTAWIANSAVGEGLLAPDGRIYEIANVASNTSLTLGQSYLGATQSGQAYVIVPTQSYIRDLAAQAADLVNNYSDIANTIGEGNFPDGELSAPAISFSDDLDTGFYRSAANEVTFVAGGVAQFKYNTSGLSFVSGGALVGTTATQTLTNKTLTSPIINSPTGITKADVGLSNVDNTSDATKNSATATLTNKTITGGTTNPTTLQEGGVDVVVQTDIGTAPNEIPLNQYLGSLAYQDLESVAIDGGVATLDTATITSIQNDTAISNVEPSLMLNFAAVKKLDPRITYARASTGVYYDGVTSSKAEENLLLRSQEFDNAAWLKANLTVVGNNAVAPDGTTTAETCTATDSSNALQNQAGFYPACLPNTVYTFSIYLRVTTGTASGSLILSALPAFSGTSITANLTTTWQRFSVTLTTYASAAQLLTGFSNVANGVVYEVWGAQLEQRSAPTAYSVTITQPITNYIPTLLTASANVARFDHDPITNESLGLLIEEQRTNLLTYSEDFSNAAWAKYQATITSNTIIAPDGTLTGDKLVEGTTNSYMFVRQTASQVSGTQYTASVYIKAAERSRVQLLIQYAGTGNGYAIFNLSTGAVESAGNGLTVSAGSVIDAGNGFYRCVLTYTSTTTGTGYVRIDLRKENDGLTYTGDGYSGIYIWGAQLEAGAFPTSYIPTVASQVTRSADSASMTGANFSSWYRADASTFYYDFSNGNVSSHSGLPPYDTLIGAVTAGQRSGSQNSVVYSLGWKIRTRITSPEMSSSIISGLGQTTTVFAPFKITTFLDQTAMGGSGNGAPVVTTTFTVPPSYPPNAFYINDKFNGCIRKISYFPARLSNEELQEMTS